MILWGKEDDEADVVFAKQGQHDVGVVQIGLGGDSRWYTEALCPFEDKGVGLVADDQGHLHQR